MLNFRRVAELGVFTAVSFWLASCNQSDAVQTETDDVVEQQEDQALLDLATVNDGNSCLTDKPEVIQWHSCNGPDSVQFGQPGTDLRGVRIDCIEGELSMAFSIPSSDEPRHTVVVDFPNGDQLRGAEIVLGDGLNAAVTFGPDSDLPLVLVAGEYFEFTFEDALYSFPVGEGRHLVTELLAQCRAP